MTDLPNHWYGLCNTGITVFPHRITLVVVTVMTAGWVLINLPDLMLCINKSKASGPTGSVLQNSIFSSTFFQK